MVAAICKDIQLRHNYLEERKLDSLYFGGGTPSLLSIGQLAQIMDALKRYFTIGHNAEITLECNPDDIDSSYLEGLKELGVNRLSLGVQSFFDTDLVFMHRAHNAKHALKSLDLIRHAGFQNVTLDLIYAAPTTTDEMWLHNLQKVVEAGVPHLSAYCLTIEENTVFGRWHKHQKMQAIDEERASSQFYVMVDMLAHAGYEQYEISNFAKPGYEAVHNGNYWKGKPYLGIGPAAHSYNGIERSWNVANNAKYMKAMANDDPAIETEVLSSADQCNEMIMTRLRTSWGLDMQTLEEKFGARLAEEVYAGLRDPWLADHVDIEGAVVRLNRRGKIMADRIAAYLFVTSQL